MHNDDDDKLNLPLPLEEIDSLETDDILDIFRDLEEIDLPNYVIELDGIAYPEDDDLFLCAGLVIGGQPVAPEATGEQPTSSTTKISIRIDSHVLQACKKEATRLGTPYQTLINHVLREEILKKAKG